MTFLYHFSSFHSLYCPKMWSLHFRGNRSNLKYIFFLTSHSHHFLRRIIQIQIRNCHQYHKWKLSTIISLFNEREWKSFYPIATLNLTSFNLSTWNFLIWDRLFCSNWRLKKLESKQIIPLANPNDHWNNSTNSQIDQQLIQASRSSLLFRLLFEGLITRNYIMNKEMIMFECHLN